MPVYCYKCKKCGKEYEEFRSIKDRNIVRICDCMHGWKKRYIVNETVVFFDDIPPYFDWSLGQKVTGRRDKANKYRAAGMTMVAGHHGGDLTMPDKNYYGDEQYHNDVILGKEKTDYEKRLDDALDEVEVK